MKKLITTLMAALPTLLLAQSAERQVIGSTGGYGTAAGIRVSSTVGEAVTATAASATVILTQGFQQSSSTVGIDDLEAGVSVTVFPNPVRDLVTLKLNTLQSMQLTFSVFDSNVKRAVLPQNSLNVSGEATYQFDFSELAAGNYRIVLTNDRNGLRQMISVNKMD